MQSIFGSDFRRVDNREYLGQPAIAVIAARTYDTDVNDLWNAVTTPERLKRWFSTVTGDFKAGGRYAIQGNASGTITRCDAPEALDLTWEMHGGTSWVTLRMEPAGPRARLTLEHIAHRGGLGEEHLKKYGPGAVGIGWDLSLHGLALHFMYPDRAVDPAEAEAWSLSDEGKAFSRGSGEAWGEAHAASGEDAAEARAKAERTIAFYTGA